MERKQLLGGLAEVVLATAVANLAFHDADRLQSLPQRARSLTVASPRFTSLLSQLDMRSSGRTSPLSSRFLICVSDTAKGRTPPSDCGPRHHQKISWSPWSVRLELEGLTD